VRCACLLVSGWLAVSLTGCAVTGSGTGTGAGSGTGATENAGSQSAGSESAMSEFQVLADDDDVLTADDVILPGQEEEAVLWEAETEEDIVFPEDPEALSEEDEELSGETETDGSAGDGGFSETEADDLLIVFGDEDGAIAEDITEGADIGDVYTDDLIFLTGSDGADEAVPSLHPEGMEAETEASAEEEAGSGAVTEAEPAKAAHAGEETETEENSLTGEETEANLPAGGTSEEAAAQAETETEMSAEAAAQAETEMSAEDAARAVRSRYTIGIDPGHQGSWVDMSDTEPVGPGAQEQKAKATTGTEGSYSGVAEYELNLAISLQLSDLLEEMGYRTVLTRLDNDTAISNSERAQLAAREGSDIYVRIHANGDDDPSVSGALVMAPSADNVYVGGLAEESQRLATCILEAYCAATGFENKGLILTDTMTGINWSTIPVMILEMGFMTNEHDDLAMQDSAVQAQMVEGIADGIDDYFEVEAEAAQLLAEAESGAEAGGAEDESEDGAAEDVSEAESENRTAAGETESEEDNQMSVAERVARRAVEEWFGAQEEKGQKWALACAGKDGEESGYREDASMQSASVIKLFIMGAVYDRMCCDASDPKFIAFGESYGGELYDTLVKMITVSDNDAANLLTERLGGGNFAAGAQIVNEFCQEYGFTGVHLGRRFLAENPTDDNYVTAADCRAFLKGILEGTLISERASARMLEILKGQQLQSKLPAGLPAGFTAANKTGEMPDGYGLGCIENDVAIVFAPDGGTYILCLLSNDLGGENDAAQQVIREISAMAAEEYLRGEA